MDSIMPQIRDDMAKAFAQAEEEIFIDNSRTKMCISKWYGYLGNPSGNTKDFMQNRLPQFCSYCADKIRCEMQNI